jgi:mannan endo-1,4-beta-mannosidase
MEELDMRRIAPILAVFVFCASAIAANINVTYNINTSANKTPISKYVYGSNWGSGTDYTIRRSGGNRLTAYNWENNWSNAGADWYYENDQYMSSSTIPGKAITDFHDQALSQGQASIVTLQMADYVSAPIWRQINLDTEAAPSIYFYPVVFAKEAPFCSPPDNPNTSDDVVYMDEFVNFLVWKYGPAGSPNGVKFYNLDNEPDIWSDGNKGATHPEVHPAKPTCLEIRNKGSALSYIIKNVDPNAQILGPVSYGFAGYLHFQGAPDWETVKGTRPWFISYYLDEMRIASNGCGRRLLDALDVHWYPEAQDDAGNRITNNISTNAMYNARMQAPRTLWDTGYISPNETYPNGEVSWINKWYFAQYLPLIPRLKDDIKNYYPDTNLAITEYAYGPDGTSQHWSTGIATADVLGIFGKYGVYIATYWGSGNYVDAAIKMYRNYDGNHSTFGDMNVMASISNKVDSSIYASVFSDNACELHLIAINKNIDNAITGTFNITSQQKFTSGRVWRFNNSSANISETTAINNITGNSFTYTIPATTVCHIVLQTTPTNWDLTGDCHVDIWDLKEFALSWLASPDNYDFIDFADFAQDWGI